MAEQFLDRPNVVPVLEQMCRKGMAESVTADPLRDACTASSGSDRALHDRFVQMIPGRWSEALVSANPPRGEDELPAPVGGRIGILPIERRRKCYAADRRTDPADAGGAPSRVRLAWTLSGSIVRRSFCPLPRLTTI
jgi:hypothetical protein